MQVETCPTLPEKFAHLASYGDWILDDESARRLKCDESSMEELQEFYDSVLPCLDSILEELNQYSLGELPEAEHNLLSIVLSFVEATMSVEMFEQPTIPYGISVERFQPLHHLVW